MVTFRLPLEALRLAFQLGAEQPLRQRHWGGSARRERGLRRLAPVSAAVPVSDQSAAGQHSQKSHAACTCSTASRRPTKP
eukprot:86637-Pyramimonas_sp.AAC.1